MHSINHGTPDECPNCGLDFTKRLGVDMGTRYDDAFPAPPHTLYAKYPRVCADPADAQRGAASSSGGIMLYIHTMGDLTEQPPGAPP